MENCDGIFFHTFRNNSDNNDCLPSSIKSPLFIEKYLILIGENISCRRTWYPIVTSSLLCRLKQKYTWTTAACTELREHAVFSGTQLCAAAENTF